MVNVLKKYWPTITFLYLVFFASITSTWVNEAFALPSAVTRFAVILVYAPPVVCVCWKAFLDLKEKNFIKICKEKDILNITFYLFAFYYAVVTAYRFLTGVEVKENLYYSLVFFGALAMYLLHRAGKLSCGKQGFSANLFAIAAAIVICHSLYGAIGYKIFSNPTINVNITSGIIVMLLPFLMCDFWKEDGAWSKKIYKGGVCIAVLVVILATGSRALFWLTLVSIFVLAFCALAKKKHLLKMAVATVCACLIFGTMLLTDVGNTRNFFCRETGISYDVLFNDGTTSDDPLPPTQAGDAPPTTNNDKVQQQVESSNYMRAELVKMGVAQIKANPWIGTGDVTYSYQLAERIFEQSSHNFIIEGLVCYGILGMLFVVVLFAGILFETQFFSKNIRKNWRSKVAFLLSAMIYFGFGMVQPTVFDVFMCPIFVLLILNLKYELSDAEEICSEQVLAENTQESENKELNHVH